GFIPKKRSDLIKRLEELKGIASTLVYFVPSRAIGDFLNIVKNILGERRILIARELTKIYEEVIIGTPSDLLKCEIVEKGEVVVIIEGKEIKDNYLIDDNIEEDLLDAIKEKKSFKDIIKNDKFKNIRRNELYRLYESLKKSGNLNGGNS
ncbi:MAG: hypothetical protein N2999_08205, partial [Proteobacteria bacterium]|nr:hypothetical protein [Pseudomonadota bacterium]